MSCIRVVRIDPEVGCHGKDYGDGCPFARYAGGLDRCAICGEVTESPAPDGCPLRAGGVVILPTEWTGRAERADAHLQSLAEQVRVVSLERDAAVADLRRLHEELGRIRMLVELLK